MKRFAHCLVQLAFGAAFALPLHAAEISLACSGVGQELALCRDAAERWARGAGHTVRIVSAPNDASERLALYQQLLAAGSDKVDVLQIDVIWPGLLGRHLLDLKPHVGVEPAEHFDGFIANNTTEGRLVAMPWFANAGLLFYRADLLRKHQRPVPATWDELTRTAQLIQDGERAAGNERMWGFVFQGRAYEGLTCNALEWIASHGGGTVVEDDGRVSVRNPQARQALQTAAGWVGRIAPRAVLNYAEEEARGVFQSGDAVFMRNWPYAWALAQAEGSVIRGKVGVAVLPKGDVRGSAQGRHASALGGEALAVSRYSRQPALAVELVLYMTSAAVQKERALRGAFNPTRPALYRDGEILRANPFMGELLGSFTSAVARPTAATGARYPQVSHELWNAAHEVLSGKVPADAALARLEQGVQRIGRRGWK